MEFCINIKSMTYWVNMHQIHGCENNIDLKDVTCKPTTYPLQIDCSWSNQSLMVNENIIHFDWSINLTLALSLFFLYSFQVMYI
jgi:hypothetical protein